MLKKKKLFSLITPIAAASIILAACGASETGTNGSASEDGEGTTTLKVGTDAAYAPFESFDDKGNIVGIDVDVVNAIGEELGVEFEINNVGWDPLFQQLINSEVDLGISAITITEERQETYDFTEPYYEATQLIVTKEESDIESLQDIADKKIGVQMNTTGHFAAQDLQGKTSANIKPYETTPVAIQELINGTVDAVIGDNAVIIEYIKNNPESKLKSIEDDSFEKEYYGLMVKKGNKEVLDILNEGIQKLKESGKLAEITGQEIE
ncbi:amino acid ABC transporter substrate-binding protein (PAAT family) [Ureibacillus chungkukjangi]|uniref:Amino acid ABC transporter substrate-binding protein (PAAT family) n=1 Tax=Ureibacillus chungkukjangi TaxID=1202712 RepID=A0A318TN90_9BACL|nr:amino acid ABC transporter substrate-binding protein (PAAT family) [Ureibacillus chungkukjangi]